MTDNSFQSLIDAIRKRSQPARDWLPGTYVVPMDALIHEIRKHTADHLGEANKMGSGEISVVEQWKHLRELLGANCRFDHNGNCQEHFVDSPCTFALFDKAVMELGATKPVSLEDCAYALYYTKPYKDNEPWAHATKQITERCRKEAKTVLDAAGVKYVD